MGEAEIGEGGREDRRWESRRGGSRDRRRKRR